ncbi:TPA: hypothetical protein ACXM56_000004 [Serratia liquefaciens]|jgi:hypothetical protein
MDVDFDEKWVREEVMNMAKKWGIKVQPPGAPIDPNWLNEKVLFRMLAIHADGNIDFIHTLREYSDLGYEEQLEHILSAKDDLKDILQNPDISALLSCAFHVDGAIKLSEAEVAKLSMLNYGANISSQVARQEIDRILSVFAYPISRAHVFRGPGYYFMFDGVSVDMKSRFSSVNDYDVVGLEYPRFARDMLRHYNNINDSIFFVTRHLMHAITTEIPITKDQLCKELLNKLAPKKLKTLHKKATGGDHYVGHDNTDIFFEDQWVRVLEVLDSLRQLVDSYRKKGTCAELDDVITFMTYHSSEIRHAKVIFGVDIDGIFNKHIKLNPSRPYRKLLLGLLDAKINVLAFHQNVSQILYDSDFLNPEFSGSLVFKQDVVKNVSKECQKEFREFKEAQRFIRERGRNLSLLAELEEFTALYMDVMMNDNGASYHRLAGSHASVELSLTTGKYGPSPIELEDSVTLMGHFFTLLSSYHAVFETKQLKRQAKNLARNKPFTRSDIHDVARKDAWAKLIRLYREENDPLVMVFTAQKAMSLIKRNGYVPKRDVLHSMSVNYGGALVGLYAKHTFSRMIPGGQVLANTGALVYSIYDVKNANSFSNLSDYPYSSIFTDETLDHDTKQKLKSENWLLIFDDNTNSGETVDNIRSLAVDSGVYARINTFTCRANPDIRNYKSTLTTEQRIDIVGVAGLKARKAKVKTVDERYKEIIGTIVGYRLSKIIKPSVPPAAPQQQTSEC